MHLVACPAGSGDNSFTYRFGIGATRPLHASFLGRTNFVVQILEDVKLTEYVYREQKSVFSQADHWRRGWMRISSAAVVRQVRSLPPAVVDILRTKVKDHHYRGAIKFKWLTDRRTCAFHPLRNFALR